MTPVKQYSVFADVKEVMALIGCKETKAYSVMKEVNKRLKEEKKASVFVKGKVLRSALYEYFGVAHA